MLHIFPDREQNFDFLNNNAVESNHTAINKSDIIYQNRIHMEKVFTKPKFLDVKSDKKQA